jgi:hypothetical protein
MISSDFGDAVCGRIRALQCGTHRVQALEQYVSQWPYAKKFRTNHAQGSLRYFDLLTKRWKIQAVVEALAEYLFKPNHDRAMTRCHAIVMIALVRHQTTGQRVEQIVLESPRDFGTVDQFVPGLGEATGLRNKHFELSHFSMGWLDNLASAGRGEWPPIQCLGSGGKLGCG